MEVTKTGTIITVTFEDKNVEFTASRIRADGDSAEVIIKWSIQHEDGSVQNDSLREKTRLLDSWAKEKLIQTLEERTNDIAPERFNWGTLISDGFMAIIDKHREGNAPVFMNDIKNDSPRSYCVKPLFINGVANLMWAKGGSSKSYFALLMCVLIDTGKKILGFSPKKGKALYLDWEEESDVFSQRLLAIQKGLGFSQPNKSGIVYKKMVGSLSNNIEVISELVLENNITFIVVDSVSPALGGDSNSQQVVEEYFASLRELDITSLSIDHANKSGEVTGKFEIHGSSFKYARARMVYELKKTQEANDNTVDVLWYHRKSNDSKMRGAIGFRIHFKEKMKMNDIEEEYDTILDIVTFEKLKLGDADNTLLKDSSLTEISYALLESHGATEFDDLLGQITAIKEVNVQPNALEFAISNSKRLHITADKTVGLVREVKEWEG